MKRLLIPFLALALCPPAQAESFISLGELPGAKPSEQRVLKIDIDSIREFKGWTFATIRRDARWSNRKFQPVGVKVHCRKKYYQERSDMKDIRRNGIWVAEVYDFTTIDQQVDNMVKYVPKGSTPEKEREGWIRYFQESNKFKENVFNFICKGKMPTSFYPG